MKNKVSKFNKTECKLSNGVAFKIVHDLPMNGHGYSFDAAFNSWIARTNKYTAESFVEYVKSKGGTNVFMTLEDFNNQTKDVSDPATKEEFESENN